MKNQKTLFFWGGGGKFPLRLTIVYHLRFSISSLKRSITHMVVTAQQRIHSYC